MSIPIVTEGSITATVNNDSQSIHFTLRQQTNIAPCFSQFFPACCEILITIQVYREKTIQILEQLPPLILNLDTTYNQSVFEVFQRTINISHCNWKGGGGASVSVSPCEEDFYEGIKSANDFKLSDLADDICVKGMGWVCWMVIDQNRQVASLDTVACFVAKTGVQLISHQK